MQGSHTLERFVNGVARDINDPETGVSVLEAASGARSSSKGTADERKDARERADLRIGALGSGSDYTPFVQHAGIASINMSFGDEDEDGIYHSIYDDFYFFTHFLDTDFAYGRALAQTVGTAVIRLADADVVPFEFTGLADTVQKYGRELKDLLRKKQDDIRERNRQIADGVFAAMRDPRRPVPMPKVEAVPPAINFAPFDNAADRAGRQRAPLRARAWGVTSQARRQPDGASSAQRQAASGRIAARSTPPACRAAAGIGICSTRPATTPATASRPFQACAKASSRDATRRQRAKWSEYRERSCVWLRSSTRPRRIWKRRPGDRFSTVSRAGPRSARSTFPTDRSDGLSPRRPRVWYRACRS